ncbi:MAG: peroxiredoxin [Salegentibacter sp.]
MALKVGEKVPSLVLRDQNGKNFNLGKLKGHQAFVVYFYPKDFTPGCTREACGFRDSYEDFKEFGAEVIGISSDSAASHQKFSSKYDLPFVFLSDEDNEGRKKFGVKANLLGLLPGRETFVFDKEGILRFRFNSINAKRHIPKALKAIRQISEK